jgi:uncharacterized protein (TIGR02266 family)
MPYAKPLKDRRKRIPLQVLISYSHEGKLVTMFCSNLSEGGVFIETIRPAPVGALLQVNFRLPIEKQSFSLQAQVVWVCPARTATSEQGMGLQFLNVDESTQKLIDRALSYFQRMLGDKHG